MSAEELNASEINVQNHPKRGCRRGCFGCLIFVLIAAVPFWRFCLHTTPLRISKETTYVTEPKTADGKRIDYFRAFEERYYPPEMKTDDNGYRLIVQKMGILAEPTSFDLEPEQYRLSVYETLNIDPNIKPSLNISLEKWSVIDYMSSQNLNDYEFLSIPWTLEKYPWLENWLVDSAPVIDLLGKAVRKPAFHIPIVRRKNDFLAGSLIHSMSTIQSMGQTIMARINYRIGIGDIDGAIDDVITLQRFSRFIRKHGTFISMILGQSLETAALATSIGDNTEHPPTKEQWKRLLHAIENLPPSVPMTDCFDGERFYNLSAIQDVYFSKFSDHIGQKLTTFLLSWSCDINIVLERINKLYDNQHDGHFGSESVQMSLNPLRYLTARSRTTQFCNLLESQFGISIPQRFEEANNIDCRVNMQHLTLALLLYEKDHGKLPDGDWQTAIRPYLSGNADKYFCCPSNKETKYTLLKDDKDLLLVESEPSRHPGGYNVSYRSGAVRFQIDMNCDKLR